MSGRLSTLNLQLVPTSTVDAASAEWALARDGETTSLVIAPRKGGESVLAGFEGERSDGVLVGPTSPKNATALRSQLEWLRPRTLGTQTSAGLGDRLGLATPGHVRAVRRVGGGIAPIFPQQSIREMARTNRTPVQVMDDATWGMFAEGWKDGTGADADHLKTTQDIDATLAVGFTFFTIDPSAHVDSAADTDELATLRTKVAGAAVGRARRLGGGPAPALRRAELRRRAPADRLRRGRGAAGRRQVRQGGVARREDVAPPGEGGGRAPGRARGLGRRDRHARRRPPSTTGSRASCGAWASGG